MSNSWDIVILGCGQLGGNLKTQLEAEKYRVLGVRRSPKPNDPTWMSTDLDTVAAWEQLAALPIHPDAVWVGIVTPDVRTPEAYRTRYLGVAERLRQLASLPGRQHPVVWVSSTAVFGDHQVGVLDESITPTPDNWRGEILREAERAIEQVAQRKTILRYTGLYASESLNRLADPVTRARLQPDTVSNRMHRDDAVSWLRFLVQAHRLGQSVPELVHGVDQCSATYADVFARIAGEVAELKSAKTGRMIDSCHRQLMPALRYPTLDQVLASS